MWDQTYDCANQHHCENDVYPLYCIAFAFCIIIERVFGVPRHGKDVVDDLNARENVSLS